MGSPIDEISPRSYPDYYTSEPDKPYHAHRQLLRDVMGSAGFLRHLEEWWHFSLGDQMWAWLYNQENSTPQQKARYGSV